MHLSSGDKVCNGRIMDRFTVGKAKRGDVLPEIILIK
jgi:hypothetical protein